MSAMRDNIVTRSLAHSFWAPGVALVGDAAHTTHPAGATGMNLAISGAARLLLSARAQILRALSARRYSSGRP